MLGRMTKQLVASIHDVTPRHWSRLDEIHQLLCRHGLKGAYAMLVVPNFWTKWPIAKHPRFVEWVRDRIDEGCEVILHGHTHLDETPPRTGWANFKGRHLTAGEGEFLSLDEDAARRKVIEGKRELESLFDCRISGFVAPAWLYSPSTKRVLQEGGFTVAEDQLHVWSPASGRTIHRGPVLSYASRTKGRMLSSLAWSRIASVALAPVPVVRFAVHPHDLDSPTLGREIDRALESLAKGRQPITYSELLR